MNIVILDHGTLISGDISPIQALADQCICYENTLPEQVVDRCAGMDVVITNKVIIDKEAMQQLSVKLICIAATGTNNIDLMAASQYGITVTHVKDYSTRSVVQHTFSLLFNLLGRTHRYISDCQQGQWQTSAHFCSITHPIEDIQQKTLSIIGFGAIGQSVAQAAKGFGMNVIVAEKAGSVLREGRVSFDEAIQRADILTLHCPLNASTENLIDSKVLESMKNHAVLINTARGGIINEQALLNALVNQEIGGAALDVLSTEPPKNNPPLLAYQGDNLIITPHIAWASQQSVSRLIHEIRENIIAFYQGISRNQV